jgi:hypothetical protein
MKNKTKSHPLVGRWFHSFASPGVVKWQGRILAVADEGVVVELFDWIAGTGGSERWVRWPAVESFALYDSVDATRTAYETSGRRNEHPRI